MINLSLGLYRKAKPNGNKNIDINRELMERFLEEYNQKNDYDKKEIINY
tara:strand:+ start:2234 stop:2380 length:147 start_codon:yes stop_codon:yes gene_type:complete